MCVCVITLVLLENVAVGRCFRFESRHCSVLIKYLFGVSCCRLFRVFFCF